MMSSELKSCSVRSSRTYQCIFRLSNWAYEATCSTLKGSEQYTRVVSPLNFSVFSS